MDGTQSHKPGLFKQPNKKFKTGRHRTKGEINRDAKGRKNAFKKQIGPGAKLVKRISRTDRLSLRKQVRQLKIAATEEQRRLEGGANRAPHLITIISLDSELLSTEVLDCLVKADEEAIVTHSERAGITYLNVPRFKSRFGFLCPEVNQLDNLLDCLKVSDVVLLLWPTDAQLSDDQRIFLDIILAHGLPTPMNLVAGLPGQGKQREQLRKGVTKTIEKWISTKSGLFFMDSPTDRLQILRHLPTMRKKPLLNQRRRPHIFVEKLEMESGANGVGTLKLTGYIRGAPMNVNKLVYIQGWGDFQLQKITKARDPRPLREDKRSMDFDEQVIAIPNPEIQESLQSEVVVDPMDSEQPEPTEDVLDENIFKVPKIKRKVPKGTSDYQAAWMIDENEDEEISDEESESDEEDDEMDVDENESEGRRVQFDMRPAEKDEDGLADAMSVVSTATESMSMAGINDAIDEAEVQRFREEVENLKWPDQVDVDTEQLARERFQRYRGLKSFRTSPWDPKENLPSDYARIFKFGNFKRTKQLVLADIDHDYAPEKINEVALPGSYVTIYISNVPAHFPSQFDSNSPLIVSGMLKHEQKFSLMNVVLRKYNHCKIPIKNKQTLIFHVGFRRFEVSAVFSQHTNGDKFKMERFMPEGTPFVASYFGPVTFGPCPVLVFLRDDDGTKHFVAYGSVSDANPDRIILKRIVLSGNPYKIVKRSAIVRFMFFNKEDIEWFKPVELYTDAGNRGHIKDSIGTHGLMKCTFNLPLKKQEQVKMNLYKRIFPPWTYAPHY
ncbi:Pre-rRNA-processing protein TSR1-like protein [Aphelenchoides besseyi]|nr:Pre-rRNA-processing protein TSR1-like protein [Aphelenchoides besseyi]KAI6194392.1 Pre-rRNA-processing protein TSR1-like protein [Aphelenchoides besseyi]